LENLARLSAGDRSTALEQYMAPGGDTDDVSPGPNREFL